MKCPRSHGLAYRKKHRGLVYHDLPHICPGSMVTTFSEWLGVKSVEVGRWDRTGSVREVVREPQTTLLAFRDSKALFVACHQRRNDAVVSVHYTYILGAQILWCLEIDTGPLWKDNKPVNVVCPQVGLKLYCFFFFFNLCCYHEYHIFLYFVYIESCTKILPGRKIRVIVAEIELIGWLFDFCSFATLGFFLIWLNDCSICEGVWYNSSLWPNFS